MIWIDWTVWVETPLRRKVDAIIDRLLKQIGCPDSRFIVIHGGDEHGYEAHFQQTTSTDWNETFVSIVEQLGLIAHQVTISGEPRTNPAIGAADVRFPGVTLIEVNMRIARLSGDL